jgi:hypothetical protein
MLRAMDTPAGRRAPAAAAFFDLDKTTISRASTLAFVPSFYRHGLINSLQAARGVVAQLFRAGGADHAPMQRIEDQVSRLCQGLQDESELHRQPRKAAAPPGRPVLDFAATSGQLAKRAGQTCEQPVQ